jgi:hypothetical protein
VEVDVFQVAPRHGRGLLILTAVAAIALSACGTGSKSSIPSGPTNSSDTSQPSATEQPTDNGSGLAGATKALADLSSFKFTMTVVGGDLSDTLASIPNAPADGVFKVSGTYIVAPVKAADITVAGSLQEISVGGNDYQDAGGQGSFIQSDTGATTLVDQLSPSTIYAAFDFTSGFTLAPSEPTDPLGTNHYQAGDTALLEFASVAGVQNANWTADVWIAKVGDYPVRISIVGTASATNKTVVYERSFYLTDVNAATNKVTAPTNVTGA